MGRRPGPRGALRHVCPESGEVLLVAIMTPAAVPAVGGPGP